MADAAATCPLLIVVRQAGACLNTPLLILSSPDPPLACSTIKGMDSLEGVPIAGCLGDQQAAMVGQRCAVREAKNTYGTGGQERGSECVQEGVHMGSRRSRSWQ